VGVEDDVFTIIDDLPWKDLVRERRHIDVGLCLFKSFISKKNCNPPSKSPLFIFFEVVTHLIIKGLFEIMIVVW